jgi:hypothetical protein
VLAEERPGGEPAVTLRKSMSVTLQPGADAVAGAAGGAHHVPDQAQPTAGAASGSSGPGALVLIPAVAATVAAGLAMRRRRRRQHPVLAR